MRSYDPVTRVMTLDDGSKFLHLTFAQFFEMAAIKPNLPVWSTLTTYITSCSSDIYENSALWRSSLSTLSGNLRDPHRLEQIRKKHTAVCIPVTEYNDPSWGEVSP